MNSKQLAQNVGRSAMYHLGEISVMVRITDARNAFGRTDYLIVPESGRGCKWVASQNLTIMIPPENRS